MKVKIHIKLIILISSLISTGLVLFIAINANRYIERMSENNAELYKAYRISELMKSFRSNIIIMDNKQQGYLVTGDGKFLEAFKLKESETRTYLKSMEKYFSGTAEEETFYKLKELTYQKVRGVKDLSGGVTAAGIQRNTENIQESGRKTMDEINSTIDEINASLAQTTQTLLDNSVEYVAVSKRWSLLEVIIGIVTALAALVFLFRDINVRSRLEKELRRAKEVADDNASAKEHFMANMSHEIRTPMNAILGFSDLLKKTMLNKAQDEYLTAIKNSGTNLLNIINDILDFSKMGAGKLRIEKISFDLTALLSSLKIMFAEKASGKNIGFEVLVDPATPQFVFGDPTRLTQILVNLVNNAIKFTEKGKVLLSCEIKHIEYDIVQFVFRVKDTGIGIPPEKQGDVFGRFNQANIETTRKYGGTGLGLAIVKELVEIQNGSIQLKSAENEGSEFMVTISYPVSYEDALSEAKDPAINLFITSQKPLTVLLAEDNALNQKLASTYLIGFGLQVDVAENGSAAIEKLKNKKYDLILLDIQMPVLDGYSTATYIRSEMNLSIPIIAMTAHIMADEKEKCIRYGMNDYISKPFKELELFRIVKKHLDEASPKIQPQQADQATEKTRNTIVDTNELFALARGNNNFVKEMIVIFLEQNVIDLREIEEGIKENDFEKVRAVSHRMRTSVGFMGMHVILVPLSELEQEVKAAQNPSTINALFETLKQQSAQGITELKNILSTIDTQQNEN